MEIKCSIVMTILLVLVVGTSCGHVQDESIDVVSLSCGNAIANKVFEVVDVDGGRLLDCHASKMRLNDVKTEWNRLAKLKSYSRKDKDGLYWPNVDDLYIKFDVMVYSWGKHHSIFVVAPRQKGKSTPVAGDLYGLLIWDGVTDKLLYQQAMLSEALSSANYHKIKVKALSNGRVALWMFDYGHCGSCCGGGVHHLWVTSQTGVSKLYTGHMGLHNGGTVELTVKDDQVKLVKHYRFKDSDTETWMRKEQWACSLNTKPFRCTLSEPAKETRHEFTSCAASLSENGVRWY